jgi:hypothetical protein
VMSVMACRPSRGHYRVRRQHHTNYDQQVLRRRLRESAAGNLPVSGGDYPLKKAA